MIIEPYNQEDKMLEVIQAFLNIFWQIILYIWEGIFAFFHFEEWLINQFKGYGVPIWIQLVTIIPFNTVLIAVETLFFRQLRKTKKFFLSLWRKTIKALPHFLQDKVLSFGLFCKRKIFKTPNNGQGKQGQAPEFLLAILNGRPIGRRVLFFLGLIPECQKIGTFVYGLKMQEYGWQGYAALCLGGALRVTIIILSPMWVLWSVVIGALSLRLVLWLGQRLYTKLDTKNKEEDLA